MMRKRGSRLHVWHGGLTGKLYAQRIDKNGGTFGERWEVTDVVIEAVRVYMEETGFEFKPKAIVATESTQAKPEAEGGSL